MIFVIQTQQIYQSLNENHFTGKGLWLPKALWLPMMGCKRTRASDGFSSQVNGPPTIGKVTQMSFHINGLTGPFPFYISR